MGTSAAPKTANKTAKSGRNGNEIPLGNHPGNTGGKKGRSGAKPLAFKAFAVSLAMNPEFQAALQKAALAGDISAAKLVIQYAEGLPPQTVQVTMSQDEARARLQAIADRAKARERAP
jgi:hypothetical protein